MNHPTRDEWESFRQAVNGERDVYERPSTETRDDLQALMEEVAAR